MANNILAQGISLYRQKSYTGALSFFQLIALYSNTIIVSNKL